MELKRVALVIALFGTWWWFSSVSLKVRSVIGAVAFFFIESSYLFVHGKGFRSTFAQFWNNVWSHPLISDVFFRLVAPDWNPYLRILAYPLVIWGLELVQSRTITVVYGCNVAWDYSGNRWSRFGGAIDLSMFTEWWLLGAAMEFLYYPYIVRTLEFY